jgi:hypothetical protein
MKVKLLIILLTLISSVGYSQEIYKKVYKDGQYHKDWRMVKSIQGWYGFIDKNDKVVVSPIYEKIEKINHQSGDYFKVKSIQGWYGIIDMNGKTVIPPNYEKIEILVDKEVFKVQTLNRETHLMDLNGDLVRI